MGRTLSWEKGRQLASDKKDDVTTTYKYDINGLRTEKRVGDKVYSYTYVDDKLYAYEIGKEDAKTKQIDVEQRMFFFYDENGTPSALVYNGSTYYYQTNLQGDVTGIVNYAGTKVVSYSYDAWGNPVGQQQASGVGYYNPLRYRGYVYDVDTNWYYLQSRYYDPETGRFLNADAPEALDATIYQIFGVTLFNYSFNNPINYIDTTGYQSVWAQVVVRFAKGTLPYKLFLFATQQGWYPLLFWCAGFFRTSDGIYHTRQDCWQQFFGYNNFYDWAFDLGTDMKKDTFPFSSKGKEYVFWIWKGDYYNLGAGAELGLYYQLILKGKNIKHWLAETNSKLTMSMTIKYKGKTIAKYKPKSKHWWITCFNPFYQNVKSERLKVIYKINFSADKKLFDDFYNKYGTGLYRDNRWEFDMTNYTATLTF